MWNYYKTVVINSDKTEDEKPMFSKTGVVRGTTFVEDGGVNVWRNGQYDLTKMSKITKTPFEPGSCASMTINCDTLIPEADVDVHDLGSYLLSFKVEMDGKFLSDYATPAYQGFYKPIVVGLNITDENAEGAALAEYVAGQIKTALPENNEFIKVSATTRTVEKDGENVTENVVKIEATDKYMFFKKESVKLEKLEETSETPGIGVYVPVKVAVDVVANEQPFATGQWILENLRLPNTLNYRYFGSNDEMPIAGVNYNQYTFEYRSGRPGLGGHSGVGQEIEAVTTHTFYVAQGAATTAFETAFASKL